MAPNQAFVFLLHSPVTELEQSQLDRIERKLDLLIRALGEEEEQQEPDTTLDGDPSGVERDQTQSLG